MIKCEIVNKPINHLNGVLNDITRHNINPVSLKYMNSTDHKFLAFEVLAVVVMKNSIMWDTMPCRPLSVN
jgi:hypothetical protein